MIIGIGNDIVTIKRIENSVKKFGDKFLNKYFTDNEISYAKAKKGKNYYTSIASAWAVKEATAKAMGTGISNDITLSSISLNRDSNGKPFVILKNGALNKLNLLSDCKNYRIFVSITHDAGLVCAVVIIETE